MPAKKWTPDQELALIDELSSMSGSKSAKFFTVHELGDAYRQPGTGSSKESKIVSALAVARREGRLESVLDAALEFVRRGERGETAGDSDFSSPLAPAAPVSVQNPEELQTPVASDRVIFVSHAFDERAVATLFVQMLKLAGVPSSKIFLSSQRSTGVPTGSDVSGELRDQLGAAKLVIALVSEHFLTRPMCVMEFGAAWAMRRDLFPVVLPPLTRGEAAKQLANLLMHQLLSEKDVSELLSDLHGPVQAATGMSISAPEWREAEEHFKNGLTTALAAAAAAVAAASSGAAAVPGAAPAGPGPAVRGPSASTTASKPRPVGRSSRSSTPAAPSIIATDSDDEEGSGLVSATEALQDALRPLDRETRRTVLHSITWGEVYRPEEHRDMVSAEKAREVAFDEDAGGYEPRESHRRVGIACDAVRKWREALESCSEAEAEVYYDEYQVNELDAQSHELWEKLEFV